MDAKQFLIHKGIFDTQYIVDSDGESINIETLLTEYQSLQLQQTGVSGRSEQLCGNLDENYNCKNMCLTHCIDGNKFYK